MYSGKRGVLKMGRKEVREFEKSKVVPYREVEFGEKGNFVRVILRGFSRQSNGDLCILYSWTTTPRKIEKMYSIGGSMDEEVEVIGVYA